MSNPETTPSAPRRDVLLRLANWELGWHNDETLEALIHDAILEIIELRRDTPDVRTETAADRDGRFTASDVRISNKQVWNAAISRCRYIVNEVADDYASLGAGVVSRQMRCVSLLLETERKPE